MKEKFPLVSVITVTYNSDRTVKDTLESIINQTYSKIEYIIIDGGSSDNTLKIIKKYKTIITKKKISFKLISEKDKGIADAWNKGLALCNGSIIGILNSDDYYEKKAIEKVVKVINPKKIQLTYGICYKINKNKEVVRTMNRNFNPNRIYLNFGFSHTTCFITSKVVKKIGNFDLNYKIAIDTDFLLRCFKAKVPFLKCNNITYMRLGGISTKFEKEASIEYEKALISNGFNKLFIRIFSVFKNCLRVLKKIVF